MIGFAIPGLYTLFELNITLLKLMKMHPEYFYDNIQIDAVYGNFPFCIFDGGRVFTKSEHVTIEDIKYISNTYNQLGIPIRLIFTNNQLQPEDYYDHFCNLTMEICENNINQITIADDGLREYIHEHYPKYRFISSTTKCLGLKDFKEELARPEFFEVCLDYNLNTNLEMLKQLTQEEKEKCEFLVNAICPPGCKIRREHYILNSKFFLNYGRRYHVPYCGIKEGILHPDTVAYHNNLSIEQIRDKYEPLGFSHFKLEGRTLSLQDMAGCYVKYMVKPEYQIYVYSFLTNSSKRLKNKKG